MSHCLNRLIADDSDPRLELFKTVLNLGLLRAPMSAELQSSIRRLQQRGLSGYDGAYAALADFVDGVWLTADERAHQKIKDLRISKLLKAD